MSDGGVNFQRLFGDLVLPLRREKLQGAHIVQAIGQFDEHHADVIHHGQHHLAHVFGLRLLRRGEVDLADLGDALDDVGDLLAELSLDLFDGYGGVFYRVVQQAGDNGGGVEPHLRQQSGNLERMHQVRLSRLAVLSFVMFEGEFVGLFDQGLIVVGPVGADLAQEIAKTCNRQNIGRDVLAQSRHVRLYDFFVQPDAARLFDFAADVLQLSANLALWELTCAY